MPPIDRTGNRNDHLYDARAREAVLGGLVLTNGVTKGNLHMMVEIILIPTEDLLSDGSYSPLEDSAGDTLERDSTELEIGSYYVRRCHR